MTMTRIRFAVMGATQTHSCEVDAADDVTVEQLTTAMAATLSLPLIAGGVDVYLTKGSGPRKWLQTTDSEYNTLCAGSEADAKATLTKFTLLRPQDKIRLVGNFKNANDIHFIVASTQQNATGGASSQPIASSGAWFKTCWSSTSGQFSLSAVDRWAFVVVYMTLVLVVFSPPTWSVFSSNEMTQVDDWELVLPCVSVLVSEVGRIVRESRVRCRTTHGPGFVASFRSCVMAIYLVLYFVFVASFVVMTDALINDTPTDDFDRLRNFMGMIFRATEVCHHLRMVME